MFVLWFNFKSSCRTAVCERYQNVSTVAPVTNEAFRSPRGVRRASRYCVKCPCMFALTAGSPHLLAKAAGTWVAPLSEFAHVLSRRQGSASSSVPVKLLHAGSLPGNALLPCCRLCRALSLSGACSLGTAPLTRGREGHSELLQLVGGMAQHPAGPGHLSQVRPGMGLVHGRAMGALHGLGRLCLCLSANCRGVIPVSSTELSLVSSSLC